MKTPPLLLGATLAFWGWQTGYWVPGVLLGAILEMSRLVKARWNFTTEEFNQLWNITVILFLGAASYAFAANEGMGAVTGFFGARSFTERSQALDKASAAVIVFLQWLPMIFFPFVAAQAYSNRDKIDFKTFSWFLRRRASGKSETAAAPVKGLNTAYPYFCACLISTSTTNQNEYFFYSGLCVLLFWALWNQRSPRHALPVWLALASLGAGLGFVGSYGLRNLQKVVDSLHVRLLSNLGRGKFDPTESRTAIGQMGRIKGSGRILLRVEIPPESKNPLLLRETTYSQFRSPTWFCGKALKEFAPIAPETNETTWIFRPAPAPATNSIIVSGYLEDGRGLLAWPHGLTRMDHLTAYVMQTNSVGTVRVDSGPGLVIYTARSGHTGTFEAPPEASQDFDVPKDEAAAIAQIAAELKLAEAPAGERPRIIERFFARHFSYCLYQNDDHVHQTNVTPLTHFLLTSRAGHCEYFATATTLLLRQAGTPARYTVGYSVQESAGANRYVVRGRHAHAWCVYYDQAVGMWRELDTTPGSWLEAEEEDKGFFEPVQDAFSWLWFQISKFRWGQGNLRQYLFYILAGVLVLLVIRFVWAKRWRRQKQKGRGVAGSIDFPGLDSEIYLVEKRLAALGLARRAGEPLLAWIERIADHLPGNRRELEGLIELHYRLRFDPQGLSPADREALRARALAWLGGASISARS